MQEYKQNTPPPPSSTISHFAPNLTLSHSTSSWYHFHPFLLFASLPFSFWVLLSLFISSFTSFAVFFPFLLTLWMAVVWIIFVFLYTACPTLTKGSNWQITQIWESNVFRLDLAYSVSVPSLELKILGLWLKWDEFQELYTLLLKSACIIKFAQGGTKSIFFPTFEHYLLTPRLTLHPISLLV